MFSKSFVPQKPFENFKWKWASLTPTENINDPIVLLGVLFRLNSLSKKNVKFSSEEYAAAMQDLQADLDRANITVNLTERTGDRNLIRNSGQYWKALGLLPKERGRGLIKLTDFGKAVAERQISKTEFSAITIQTLSLPNDRVQPKQNCDLWTEHHIKIFPLKIILFTLHLLKDLKINNEPQGWITANELIKIIIPLSACNASNNDYANFIYWHRTNQISLENWPDCAPEPNDKRMAREYLLFLKHYGYITSDNTDSQDRYGQKYIYNEELDEEIMRILEVSQSKIDFFEFMKNSSNISAAVKNIERKRYNTNNSRPLQAQFRQDLFSVSDRCLITRVRMPGLLEAAHIMPYKYNGPDSRDNGILLRKDIHYLFDSGNLRIDVEGNVVISQPVLEDYGRIIPEKINIPDYVNKDYIRWRWDNYDGE
jgi:Predicted restriction endonuclease